MADEKWEFLFVFFLGVFVGWMLNVVSGQRQYVKPSSRKTSTTYTKTDTGFNIQESVVYE
jgi:hypothetical protein